MFDNYTTGKSHTEYVPYDKTITEKRAPTDDSIRLANEYKDKILNDLMGSAVLNNNEFNCAISVYQNPAMFNALGICIDCWINNKKIQFRKEYEPANSFRHPDKDTAIRSKVAEIVKDFADVIAREILSSVSTELCRPIAEGVR